MTLNPNVQAHAQKEIDSVTGCSRLPTLADRTSLPYLEAILFEVLRLGTVVPVIARRLNEDDIHNGYLIPRGTTVVVNLWYVI
jgi:cytochrome P450